ncbi:MAG: amylo-alpha-1,6-glucosidase [Planctomycetota bacterium]
MQATAATPSGTPSEWLLTNTVGSFAMGTPQRCPTRKYHGLLIARPVDGGTPQHILAEVDERILVGDAEYALASFQYDSCVHPDGAQYQTGFIAAPPTWRYTCGDVQLERRLSLDEGHSSATIHYQVLAAPGDVELLLTPLLTGRRVHDLTQENSAVRSQACWNETVEVTFPGVREAVALGTTPTARVEHAAYWNRRVHYTEEERRGYPHVEDLYAPACFRLSVRSGDRIALRVAYGVPRDRGLHAEVGPTQATSEPTTTEQRDGDADRGANSSVVGQLMTAAAAYCVARPSTAQSPAGTASIVAGFPWFGEWGRDAFIALPGLTLARGQHALAGQVLDHFRDHRQHGLIPNIVGPEGDGGDDHSVDATLFFIRAVQRVEQTCGSDFTRRWWPDVLALLEVLRSGRARGIAVESSGLLAADRRPRAMTWMDALIDGKAVTPRAPYAVEIQALFHDAVHYGLQIAGALDDSNFAQAWGDVPQLLQTSFLEMFDQGTHLADSSDGTVVDAAVRPNQLFAVSGDHPLVAGDLARAVLASVRRELLTPFGLRTLEPTHPDYRGRCEGTQPERDQTYHQGTVWPWLLGPYVDAVVTVEGARAARAEARRIITNFRPHLELGCIGHVSEIFDGDAPHTPRGAPAQAWSVSELLRIAKMRRGLRR